MTFNNNLLQWIPAKDQAGDYFVEIKAIDPQNASASQVFAINVIEYNLSPIITSVPNRYAKISESYEYQLLAFDPEGKTVIFSFSEPPPEGMTIDPASGIVRWKPGSNMIGTHRIAIKATDHLGATGAQVFNLEVIDPASDLQILSPTGSHADLYRPNPHTTPPGELPKGCFFGGPVADKRIHPGERFCI